MKALLVISILIWILALVSVYLTSGIDRALQGLFVSLISMFLSTFLTLVKMRPSKHGVWISNSELWLYPFARPSGTRIYSLDFESYFKSWLELKKTWHGYNYSFDKIAPDYKPSVTDIIIDWILF